MQRGIMLDQFSNRGGDDLTVVGFLFAVWYVTPQFFGALDDGWHGYMNPMAVQPVSDG